MNRTERDEELAAVDRALHELPPIDPPARVVQRTLLAVARQADTKRNAWRLGVMAASLASVLVGVGVVSTSRRDMVSTLSGPTTGEAMGGEAALRDDRVTLARETPAEPRPEELAQNEAVDVAELDWQKSRNKETGGEGRGWGDGESKNLRGQAFDQGAELGDDLSGTLAVIDGKLEEKAPAGRDDWAYKIDVDELDHDGTRDTEPGFDVGNLGRFGEDVPKTPETLVYLDGNAPDQTGQTGQTGQLDSSSVVVIQPGYFDTTVELPASELRVPPAGTAEGGEVISGLVTRLPADAPEAFRAGQIREQGHEGQGQNREVSDKEVQKTSVLESDIESDLRGLRFIEPRGYFANTYIPGDSDLVRFELAAVSDKLGGNIPTLDAVRGVEQPFDRPVGQALSLQLAADRTAVEGPTRVTLQVGLAGAAPVKTRRAPLAVALVVDAGSVADEAERQTLWSIASSFVAERQAGDVFAVVVPTSAGPVVLQGDALDAAELTRVLAAAAEARVGLDLASVQAGYHAISAGRQPTTKQAPAFTLGASTVVLATARPLGADLAVALGERAHREAIADVQLSVVGVGPRAERQVLATLAQHGQGRRWLATSPDDARRVVGEELGSAGRTVARALRLRIRLAPGVQLVGVVGSHPLRASERRRVKDAESAIDQKVAQTIGIASDRGDDEDGIQIVIPAFMAGDDHAILLDVVVPGPGPVLDVRARWKDLLRMDNAEAQASLSLPSGADQATPLALNVVENRAAMIASDALLYSARQVALSQPANAQPRLSIARQELEAMALRTRSVLDEAKIVEHYQALLLRAPAWIQDDASRAEMVRALEDTGRTLR